MADAIDTGDTQQRPPPYTCKQCGGTALPQALLDSRRGKKYRLLRCQGCEELSWSEE